MGRVFFCRNGGVYGFARSVHVESVSVVSACFIEIIRNEFGKSRLPRNRVRNKRKLVFLVHGNELIVFFAEIDLTVFDF